MSAVYNPGPGPHNNPQTTIAEPLQPPPQQLTTQQPGNTILGALDGVNALFTWGIWVPQYQVFRNGVLQATNTDYAGGPTSLKFLPGAVPQIGDIVTINIFGTF